MSDSNQIIIQHNIAYAGISDKNKKCKKYDELWLKSLYLRYKIKHESFSDPLNLKSEF